MWTETSCLHGAHTPLLVMTTFVLQDSIHKGEVTFLCGASKGVEGDVIGRCCIQTTAWHERLFFGRSRSVMVR